VKEGKELFVFESPVSRVSRGFEREGEPDDVGTTPRRHQDCNVEVDQPC